MPDMEALKQQLLAKRKEYADRVSRIHTDLHRREEPFSADFAEQVVEQENLDVLHSLEAEGRAELLQIDRALERIERGEYGYCVKCGAEISAGRLEALPYTGTCIDCAT